MKIRMFRFLIAALLLMVAFNAQAFTVAGINYSVSSGVATVTGATSKDITSLTIPATVPYNGKTYPVNFISHSAFNNYKSLREVIFEESDTFIGSPVYTSSMGTQVNTSPFVGCPIESYWCGRDLCNKIGNSIYADMMRLSSTAESVSLTFAGKTTYVMNLKTFHSDVVAKVTSLSLGGDIKEINGEAFKECDNLTTLTLLPGNVVEFLYSTFPAGHIIDRLIFESNQYRNISYVKFRNLEFGDLWTAIPEEMFYYNNEYLETVKLGANVEEIGNKAFYNCASLVEVYYPDALKNIGADAFFNCTKLTTPQFNNSIETIGRSAFEYCESFTEIILPGSLKEVGPFAFNGAVNVNKIVLNPSEENNTLPIGGAALGVGELDSLIVNRVVSSDVTPVFSNGIPRHLVIGDCWTEISKQLFYDNSGRLETVVLGANIKTIGQSVFETCSSISEIKTNAKVPPLCDSEHTFESAIYPTAKLLVPIGSKRAYASAPVWKNFLNIEADGSFLVTVDYDHSRGKVSLNGTETDSLNLDEGEALVVAIAPATGFYIEAMTANGQNCMDKLVNGALRYDELTDSLHFVVDFEPREVAVTVKVSPEGGHIEINGSRETPDALHYGSRVELKPVPDEGYELKSFMINGEAVEPGSDGVYIIESLEADLSIEVVFEIIRYKAVAVYDHEMGTVLLNGNADEIDIVYGGELKIETLAAEGHYVSTIKVNDEPKVVTSQPLIIEAVFENQIVEVSFDIYKYLVEAVYNQQQGRVIVNDSEGSAEVEWNTDVVVNIEPAYGFLIASVLLDEKDVTADVNADGSLNLAAVKAAHKLVVEFEIKRVRLSIAGIEGGVLTSIHDFGTEIRYIPEAAEGWEFHSATVGETVIDDLADDGSFIVGPLTENTTVTVVFRKTQEGNIDVKDTSALIKVSAKGHTVNIKGAPDEAIAAVYDEAGLNHYYGTDRSITLEKAGVYIVSINGRTFKVLLH